MKKLMALLLLCAMLLPAAHAAQWAEGRSPAQPYSFSVVADLTKSLGHIIRFPMQGIEAEHFCDMLHIYLPREDVRTGEGHLRLYDGEGLVTDIDFADENSVAMRPMTEAELNGLLWGSGVSFDIFLPVSLTIGADYYVLMDGGCIVGTEYDVSNPPITNSGAWTPTVTGDYGVSGLFYSAPLPEEAEAEAPAGEQQDAPAAGEEAPEYGEIHMPPQVGDIITFDIVLGGAAKHAVIYRETDAVFFQTMEYDESATASGVVMGGDTRWGVIFMDENYELLSLVELGR